MTLEDKLKEIEIGKWDHDGDIIWNFLAALRKCRGQREYETLENTKHHLDGSVFAYRSSRYDAELLALLAGSSQKEEGK